jgi:lipopolysaccharide export system permease protein
VINEVSPGKFYLRAGHLDEASNMMREVTIYDMADPTRRRTIFADSGNMRMSKGLTDLELTLYNGNMQDVPTANPDELQRLYFNVDQIRVRGVGNQFQKTTADTYKSDREMTVCEMQAAQDRARVDHEAARKDFASKLAALRKSKATLSKDILHASTSAPWDIGLGRLYCNAVALFAPKEAKAQGVSTTPSVRVKQSASSTRQSASSTRQSASSTRQSASSTQQSASSTSQSTSSTATTLLPPAGRLGPAPQTPDVNKVLTQAPPPNSSDLVAVEGLRIRLQDSAQLMNSYGVEIHKKFALAVACFVFVLLGAPIALRFPRGGVGLTIGVSLFVFALYYVCLIAGETIAKRGLMPAVVSMWMANVIFALAALWMLAKMGREGTTARGGDMSEMIGAIKGSIRSKIGWKNRRVQRERVAA